MGGAWLLLNVGYIQSRRPTCSNNTFPSTHCKIQQVTLSNMIQDGSNEIDIIRFDCSLQHLVVLRIPAQYYLHYLYYRMRRYSNYYLLVKSDALFPNQYVAFNARFTESSKTCIIVRPGCDSN